MRTRLTATLFVLLVSLSAGCTHVMEVPLERGVDYSGGDTVNADIVLVLDERWRTNTYDNRPTSVSDRFVIPLGESLANNSEAVVRSVFADVTVVDDMNEVQEDAQGLVLHPGVIEVNDAMGMWAWNENSMTISTEWEMLDAGGQTLWAKTIKGTGKNEAGTLFSYRKMMSERAGLMLDDLFLNVRNSLLETRTLIPPSAQ